MLAITLKEYLKGVPDEINILIFTTIGGDTRQLIMGDIDVNHEGNIVIDAEYSVPVKTTKIER